MTSPKAMPKTAGEIACREVTECPVCAAAGRTLYRGMVDRLFDAPGTWGTKACTNPDCGSLWLDPMPDSSELGRFYLNYYTHHEPDEEISATSGSFSQRLRFAMRASYLDKEYRYPSNSSRWRKSLLNFANWLMPMRRARLDHSVIFLPAVAGGRVLDVGCGNGWILKRLSSLGWQAEGIDFDEQAVKTVREQGLSAGLGSLESQKFPDCLFDAVVMSHVIEHVPNPSETIAECLRVLKPGGRLVIVTPNAASLGHSWYGSNWMALDPPRHLYLQTPASLARAARGVGFDNVQVRTSARGAAKLFRTSSIIATGQDHAFTRRGSWWQRRWSYVLESVAMLRLAFSPMCGDELICICEKGDSAAGTLPLEPSGEGRGRHAA